MRNPKPSMDFLVFYVSCACLLDLLMGTGKRGAANAIDAANEICAC